MAPVTWFVSLILLHFDNYLYLVLDYFGTDLKIHIGSEPVDPSKIRIILYQLCQGVAYCHNIGVLHRDLKPEYLLIEQNEGDATLKIADLGLRRAFTLPDTPYTDEIVTLWYRAPKVLLGSFVKFTGVDIWAVGCIFC
ncbi:cyclin-dependent kinase B1-1-like [Bidens hawaiensis]|uniref:cyclin-dependent kinase B1-1-like n=1 Tax=Bidens hawaiensis TaxID=980011 RepID=UPI00404A0E03